MPAAAASRRVVRRLSDFTGYSQILPYQNRARNTISSISMSATGAAAPYFGWTKSENSTAYGICPSTFLCPSNRGASEVTPFINYTGGVEVWRVNNPGVTDYVFNGGASRSIYRPYGRFTDSRPVRFDSSTKWRDIVDGLFADDADGRSGRRQHANKTLAVTGLYGTDRRCPASTDLAATGGKTLTLRKPDVHGVRPRPA